jgi:hypothetical protein
MLLDASSPVFVEDDANPAEEDANPAAAEDTQYQLTPMFMVDIRVWC